MTDLADRALARLTGTPRREGHPVAWRIGTVIGHAIFIAGCLLAAAWLYRAVTS
jgi:hypothetical protein